MGGQTPGPFVHYLLMSRYWVVIYPGDNRHHRSLTRGQVDRTPCKQAAACCQKCVPSVYDDTPGITLRPCASDVRDCKHVLTPNKGFTAVRWDRTFDPRECPPVLFAECRAFARTFARGHPMTIVRDLRRVKDLVA
jgi:hypothetical protein